MAEYSGTFSGTYVLTATQTAFYLTKSGEIAGTDGGLALDAAAVPNVLINNAGGIAGASGQLFSDPGHGAGVGIYLEGGALINSGGVTGGKGFAAEDFFGYEPSTAGADAVTARYSLQVNNSGVIAGGAGGNGAYDFGSGSAGGVGLNLYGGGAVVNSGRIAGGAGGSDPHYFATGGAGGTAIVFNDIGSVVNTGVIQGGNSGRSLGDITGGGGDGIDFENSGTLVNAAGATILGGTGNEDSQGGTGVVLFGGSISDAGLIEGGNNIYAGGTGGFGVFADSASVTLSSGGFIEGGRGNAYTAANGAGVVLAGSTLNTDGTITGGSISFETNADSVFFEGLPSSMTVGHGAVFNGAIGGFQYGDSIDLKNLSLSFVDSHFNAATDTVNAGLDGTLKFAGDPTLIFTSDGSGGVLITTPCFRRGTRITTEHGERPIESLEIGDRVLTRDRELKPIRWIGRRHYAGASLAGRREVLPVLIRAGALGEQLPQRDLWVSPEHALYLNGALVPASLLTNDLSILTDDSPSSVTYYHLEFDDQEVIFAEGAAAESFVDDDSRRMFDNAAEYPRLYPAAPHKAATFCAPRIEEGEALEALRERLVALAGILTGVQSYRTAGALRL